MAPAASRSRASAGMTRGRRADAQRLAVNLAGAPHGGPDRRQHVPCRRRPRRSRPAGGNRLAPRRGDPAPRTAVGGGDASVQGGGELQVTNGRPVRCRWVKVRLSCSASSASTCRLALTPLHAKMPVPRPRRWGLGSGWAKATRLAHQTAAVHGPSAPDALGSRLTWAVPPRARTPAARSATTSACGDPSTHANPRPRQHRRRPRSPHPPGWGRPPRPAPPAPKGRGGQEPHRTNCTDMSPLSLSEPRAPLDARAHRRVRRPSPPTAETSRCLPSDFHRRSWSSTRSTAPPEGVTGRGLSPPNRTFTDPGTMGTR